VKQSAFFLAFSSRSKERPSQNEYPNLKRPVGNWSYAFPDENYEANGGLKTVSFSLEEVNYESGRQMSGLFPDDSSCLVALTMINGLLRNGPD